MARYRDLLPQLDGRTFLTDGGLHRLCCYDPGQVMSERRQSRITESKLVLSEAATLASLPHPRHIKEIMRACKAA